MRVGFLGLALAGIAAIPSPDPSLTIVARETFPATVIETIEYIKPDRTRIEWRVAPAPSGASRAPIARDGHSLRSARITRCDLRTRILLNYDDRTYRTEPLQSEPEAVRRLTASLASRKDPEPNPPNLLIETTTVQTGERTDAFGYTARRVVTTRRDIPLDGKGDAQSETETDGWYIDLDTRPSCERLDPAGVRSGLIAVATPSNATTRRPEVPIVTFREIGPPERGYPIEMRTAYRSPVASSKGAANQHAFVTRKVVTQLSREPLDPVLFDIPGGFRAGEGRLVAFAAYWIRAWDTVKAVVAPVFR